MKQRRALLSVSDKTGLADLAKGLVKLDFEILSTGGTAAHLREGGVEVTDVADVTGFPEIMDGRVKTLHPAIHAGLLASRNDAAHTKALAEHDIGAIDLLAVNLYPFERKLEDGATFAQLIEHIDIGGPAMLRAAAKNHESVVVLCDPEDYDGVLRELAKNGGKADVSDETKRRLAASVFAHTAAYDAAIAGWLAGDAMGPVLAVGARRMATLRYGENPHQEAALYATGEKRPGVATARQIQGKPLSYNNINDTNAAFELVAEFEGPGVAIIKHANPCGVACGQRLDDAWDAALAADPVSAFGGVVACNRELDEATANKIAGHFIEVVIAPGADAKAIAALSRKPDLRLLLTDATPRADGRRLRVNSVAGAVLVQTFDDGTIEAGSLQIVTREKPSKDQIQDLLFAWRVAKHVKSNAIVFARDRCTVGIGAGQMSRVDSVRLAIRKARDIAEHHGWDGPRTKGAVAASDAFFPFADGIEEIIGAGATAIIQPGGSKRDDEVIAAANAAGIAMAFTNMRHFSH